MTTRYHITAPKKRCSIGPNREKALPIDYRRRRQATFLCHRKYKKRGETLIDGNVTLRIGSSSGRLANGTARFFLLLSSSSPSTSFSCATFSSFSSSLSSCSFFYFSDSYRDLSSLHAIIAILHPSSPRRKRAGSNRSVTRPFGCPDHST